MLYRILEKSIQRVAKGSFGGSQKLAFRSPLHYCGFLTSTTAHGPEKDTKDIKVPIDLVKQLREKTKYGVLDCRNALAESGLDFQKAEEWLRKKSKVIAQKKSSKSTSEGLVCAVLKPENAPTFGLLLEMNSETDFCSRSALFQQLVRDLTTIAIEIPEKALSIQSILNTAHPSAKMNMAEHIQGIIAQLRENIVLRRVSRLSGDLVSSCVHNSLGGVPHVGTIGALIAFETQKPKELVNFGNQLAKHVIGMETKYLSVAEIPQDLQQDQSHLDSVLFEQEFVFDSDLTVKQAILEQEKKIGSPIKVSKFIRFKAGEGIEVARLSLQEEVQAKLLEKD